MNIFSKLARKSKLVIAGSVLAVAFATAATVGISPAKAIAASCDQVNIIHCGLDGSSVSGYISSFKSFYNKNSDNGHNDLQAVYNWSGISDADVSNMNTSNTKVGTLYRSGDVKVDGKVVATDAWVSARFTEGDGFVKIKDGVWARKTTTSFANASVTVLVHYNGDTVDSVVMVDCGNAVKVTPVKPTPPPAPKPVLVCKNLVGAVTGDALTFKFTATATATNTKVVKYVFDFGDNTSTPVVTSALTASTTHKFAAYDKTYAAKVTVTDTEGTTVTCVFKATTPPAPVKPSLTCDSLVATGIKGEPMSYTFVARATAHKTTITKYAFAFSDKTTKTVETSASTATANHTFSEHNKTYTATVVVSSTDTAAVGGTKCTVQITTPKPDECKPGVPKGDSRCTECKPGVPAGDSRCTEVPAETCVPTDTQDENCEEKPTTLVNTGPGAIAGLFAGTSAIGAAAHQIVRRRKSRD